MSVTARFKVDQITEADHGTEVALSAVTDDREENKTWSQYTPAGNLHMTITNPAASSFFEVGEEYQLEFTKV